jgi:hypothetical protein
MQCISVAMQPEQQIIVDWMARQLRRMGIRPQAWAERAGVYPTTITRAMKPDYTSVTAIPTLVALARAAQVPSVLDFLEAQDASGVTVARATAPPAPPLSEDDLAPLLAALLPLVPKGSLTESAVRDLAAALSYGLELLAVRPAKPATRDAIEVAVRGAVARFRADAARS